MENLQRLLSDLYYIGKLKEGGEKLNPVYKSIDRGILASMMRYLFHTKCNREVNFEFIKTAITEAFQTMDLYSHKEGELAELVTYRRASEILLEAIEGALNGLKIMKINYQREHAREGFLTDIEAYEKIITLKVDAWREKIPALVKKSISNTQESIPSKKLPNPK